MDTLQRSTFTVRTYGRTELAQLYNPHIDPKNAFRKLRAWIAYNPALTQQLAALGYDGRARTFTPAQVAAIVRFLGEP
ncbi:MAG: DUF4248 domain-containing protein [Mediterranea massiliensis]|nr:DUF4248 domain-containing protein [Mediterranea massiliensis]MBO5381473.1 DUF4248 domain-containing protein [Bacteroides sp.]